MQLTQKPGTERQTASDGSGPEPTTIEHGDISALSIRRPNSPETGRGHHGIVRRHESISLGQKVARSGSPQEPVAKKSPLPAAEEYDIPGTNVLLAQGLQKESISLQDRWKHAPPLSHETHRDSRSEKIGRQIERIHGLRHRFQHTEMETVPSNERTTAANGTEGETDWDR